jgi:hypothetical protein
VRLCHDEWGAAAVDWAMAEAAKGGHEAIVRLCLDEWGAPKANRAMAAAAGKGHEAIVRLCHDEWGATDVKNAMAEATEGGHKAVVQLCLEWAQPHDRFMAFSRGCGRASCQLSCGGRVGARLFQKIEGLFTISN